MGLSLKYRPVIKAKSDNCCAEDLPQVRQVQVLEGVQGLPPGVVYGLEWVTVSLPVPYRGGVAQGGEALDEVISRSRIQVARQTCPVHLERSRRVRGALDPSPSMRIKNIKRIMF